MWYINHEEFIFTMILICGAVAPAEQIEEDPMGEIKKRKKTSFEWYVFFVVIVIFLFISWILSASEPAFDEEKVQELDTVWYGEGQSEGADSLPAIFAHDENGTANVYTTISEEWLKQGNTICFRASQEAVRIWIDGELMLEQGNRDAGIFGKTPSSGWVILRLPMDSAGKELRIELTSPYESYQGVLNKVYIGTKTALLFYILHTYALGFAVAVLLIIISVILFLFYMLFWVRKMSGNQFLLLAFFGMLAGIWVLGESHMLQFFTGKLQAWYNITMIAMHMLPLPLLKMMEKLPDYSYWRISRNSRYFLMLYLMAVILLQVTGVRDFMQMLNVSLVILLLICLSNLFFICWEFFCNNNREILPMVVAISVLSLFACMELVYSLINIRRFLGVYLQIGVLAFYVVVCIFSIRDTFDLYVEGLKSEYYKKLSYTDQMTGCMNRRAFTEKETSWVPGGSDILLMVDLNNLKQINDQLGHHMGDIYIRKCADAILEIFGGRGICYRMGGDEFLFWGNAISEIEMEELKKRCRDRVRETCAAISPLCGVAMGHAAASSKDTSVEDILKRADEKMYENKRNIK